MSNKDADYRISNQPCHECGSSDAVSIYGHIEDDGSEWEDAYCWKDTVYYDESSESCLRWKINVYTGKKRNVLAIQKDSVVGYIRKDGYYIFRYKYKLYYCHRIIWELYNGKIKEGLVIDHIDRNKSNNKIENLRIVEEKYNLRNTSGRKHNTTGAVGVYRQKSTKHNYEYFTVQCYDIDGKRITKCFSIDTYGEELAFELAKNYRQDVMDRLQNLGAGYTDYHMGEFNER